jgi:hypothetical protein
MPLLSASMIGGGLGRQLPCTHAVHLIGATRRAWANSKWAKITFPAKYYGVVQTNSFWTNDCRRCAWQMIVRSTTTDFSEWPPPPSLRSAAEFRPMAIFRPGGHARGPSSSVLDTDQMGSEPHHTYTISGLRTQAHGVGSSTSPPSLPPPALPTASPQGEDPIAKGMCFANQKGLHSSHAQVCCQAL